MIKDKKKNDNSFKFIYIIENEVIFRFFSFFLGGKEEVNFNKFNFDEHDLNEEQKV